MNFGKFTPYIIVVAVMAFIMISLIVLPHRMQQSVSSEPRPEVSEIWRNKNASLEHLIGKDNYWPPVIYKAIVDGKTYLVVRSGQSVAIIEHKTP